MNSIQNYLQETEEEFEEKIFKIVSRIIGTAIQEGTITGKYADDFEKYRNEISEIISQEKQKSYQEGRKEVIAEIIAKIEKTKDENFAFMTLSDFEGKEVIDWTIPRSEVVEILNKLKDKI